MTTRIQANLTLNENESVRITREPVKPPKSQFQIIEEIAKSREGKTRWR